MDSDIIKIQTEAFDAGAYINQLTLADSSMGAVASFIGVMRDTNEGDEVTTMTLEHYPGMTEKALHAIIEQARHRWQLGRCILLHRVGPLLPSDQIVLVAVSSSHRKQAFQACEFIIDYLKNEAPFWKKETTSQGERWVEERKQDKDALKQWNESD